MPNTQSLRTPVMILAIGLAISLFLNIRHAGQPQVLAQGSYPASTATATATATTTSTPTVRSTTVGTAAPFQPAPTITPLATSLPATATPVRAAPASAPGATTAPTSAIQPTAPPNAISCDPNQMVEISGQAPARAALLVYFAERVIGGGSARADGSFRIPIQVGNEKPGSYTVTVRVRGTWQQVAQVSCIVPALTPTARVAR
ncbi:MAG: hypothetical protein Fur005_18780 [Roseiflexaceae bacterium]